LSIVSLIHTLNSGCQNFCDNFSVIFIFNLSLWCQCLYIVLVFTYFSIQKFDIRNELEPLLKFLCSGIFSIALELFYWSLKKITCETIKAETFLIIFLFSTDKSPYDLYLFLAVIMIVIFYIRWTSPCFLMWLSKWDPIFNLQFKFRHVQHCIFLIKSMAPFRQFLLL
jgi:hypothetical protein